MTNLEGQFICQVGSSEEGLLDGSFDAALFNRPQVRKQLLLPYNKYHSYRNIVWALGIWGTFDIVDIPDAIATELNGEHCHVLSHHDPNFQTDALLLKPNFLRQLFNSPWSELSFVIQLFLATYCRVLLTIPKGISCMLQTLRTTRCGKCLHWIQLHHSVSVYLQNDSLVAFAIVQFNSRTILLCNW